MTNHRLPWTRLCVATLLTLCAGSAQASTTHKVKPGENLSTLAHKYHVTPQDIAKANNITETTVLALGRTLTIPDPPKHLVVHTTLYQAARVNGDRASVRLGPGADYRRAFMFDKGDKVIVTARRDGWAQVELPGGKYGWIRSDLLGKRRADAAQKVATNNPPARKDKAPRVAHNEALIEDRPRKRHRVAESHARVKTRTARRARGHHETQVARIHSRHHARLLREARRHHAVHYARRARHHHGRFIPEASAPEATSDVVRSAYSYRGTPYVWGGAARGGFDCSGFTSYLYHHQGVNLPHSASAQFHHGRKVGRGELKPGDLVFFETVHRGISHVGMYVGKGRFVHASSRRAGGVRVDSLESGYYNERFRGARRVK